MIPKSLPVTEEAPEPTVRVISRLSGTIVKAGGLLNTKLIGKGAPRCYVKGIKGNSHLVDLYCTQTGVGSAPEWEEMWDYNCLATRNRDEFVGLKFIVCDGEEFLGGADFDLSQLSAHKEAVEELELTGIVFAKVQGVIPRKARLFLRCSVERKFMPGFPRPQKSLMSSMRTIDRVTSICGRVVRARGLHNERPKKGLSNKKRSSPMCYVRCYMMSGKILTVHTTGVAKNISDPSWDEIFTFDFDDENDQPIMLMFEIKGTASMPAHQVREIFKDGDHLGSCMLLVGSIGDETVYAQGKGRVNLPVLGDFQQIENRLEKETVKDEAAIEEAVQREKKKGTWEKRLEKATAVAAVFGFGAKSTKVHVASFLTVQLFAERGTMPMPHCPLMDEPIMVEEADLDDAPDPELRKFFGQIDEFGERVKRLEIAGQERAVTIYGRVKAATDLIAADITGTSDPYVIVEALTKHGELLFVYRTRYIQSNLNPEWGEAFFWKVPPDPDNPLIPVSLSKLQFSIYDSDEGQISELITGGGGDDDFLGRCGVDISYLRNNDSISEDVPLLGVKAKPGGFKTAGGFRRYSTISVEIRVERRVKRVIDQQFYFDNDMLDVPRHHPSRPMLPPTVKAYKDFSQERPESKQRSFDKTAGKVLTLRDSNSLAKLSFVPGRWRAICGTDGEGWLQSRPVTSPFVAVTAPPAKRKKKVYYEEEDELAVEGDDLLAEVSNYRRNWGALKEDWNDTLMGAQAGHTLKYENLSYVNRLPPFRRTTSTPIIMTRFGRSNYEKLATDPFEDPMIRNLRRHVPPIMLPAGAGSEVATKNLSEKPPLDRYSRRRRDIQSAPAKLLGPL